MPESLKDFLAKPHVRVQCQCCNNPDLAVALVTFLDLLLAGGTSVPLQVVWENHLSLKHDKPRAISSVRRHIKSCLRRNATTGAAL